jgi:hypothetical protein
MEEVGSRKNQTGHPEDAIPYDADETSGFFSQSPFWDIRISR